MFKEGTAALSLALCLMAEVHGANANDMLLKTGDWRVFRANDFFITMGEGDHFAIDGMCVAETGGAEASLAFATFPKLINSDASKLSGIVFIQATSRAWNFRTAEKSATLSPGINLEMHGAIYDQDMIMYNGGGYGKPPVEVKLFVDTAKKSIEVLDNSEKKLATFSAKGLAAAYKALLKCGGIS